MHPSVSQQTTLQWSSEKANNGPTGYKEYPIFLNQESHMWTSYDIHMKSATIDK